MPALDPATFDQRATVPCAHPSAKAVLALPAAVVGLVCSLHDQVPLAGGVA